MKRIIIRLTPEAEEVYQSLKSKASHSKQEEALLNSFLNKIELTKNNIQYGQPIAKKLIPEEYKVKYGITNLFRVQLPYYWRMLYSLMEGDNETLIIVVDLIDHKKYNKKFGYKS